LLLGRIDEMVKAWLSSAIGTGKVFARHLHGIAGIMTCVADFARASAIRDSRAMRFRKAQYAIAAWQICKSITLTTVS
jgi:hypothetical protein